MIPSSDLTKERSLFQLYKISYKFETNRFNLITTLIVAILLTIYSYLAWNKPEILLNTYTKYIDIGLTFATSILGFLVAGFTIFVTVTKTELFIEMAKKRYEESDQSYFKYVISCFVIAFVHYVSYLFVCLMSNLLLGPDGFSLLIYNELMAIPTISLYLPLIKKTLTAIGVIGIGSWSAYLVLLLKSFIFNIYSTIALAVRWEIEKS